jgi:hypothetical protein
MLDAVVSYKNISDFMISSQTCEGHFSQTSRSFVHDLSAVDRNLALEVDFGGIRKDNFF